MDSNYDDVSKVTKIVSSESISIQEAFDITTRFLMKSKTGVVSTTTPILHQVIDRNSYHFWEDLYNIAETLVDDTNVNATVNDEQLATLRKLRLSTATSHSDNDNNIVMNANNDASNENNIKMPEPSNLTIPMKPIKQEVDDEGKEGRATEREKIQQKLEVGSATKKEKKKEKKRKRQ